MIAQALRHIERAALWVAASILWYPTVILTVLAIGTNALIGRALKRIDHLNNPLRPLSR